MYIHYTETNVHLWIYECTSMDLRMRIYGSTNVHLWIYECISMDLRMYIYGSTNAYLWIYECAIVDEQTLHHRSNGATPLVEQKTADI